MTDLVPMTDWKVSVMFLCLVIDSEIAILRFPWMVKRSLLGILLKRVHASAFLKIWSQTLKSELWAFMNDFSI